MSPTPRPGGPGGPGGTTRLGRREVARIGYGTMQLAERAPDEQTALAVLRGAVERGVDHLDTAHFYGDDAANRLIRAALAPYPENLSLATKVGAERHGDTLVAAQRPQQLADQVHTNLRTLGVERLDVVNLRRMDAAPGIVATGDQLVDLDDQLAALVELRDSGLVGAIGLSNVDVAQLERALPVDIACVQNAASLLDRSAEPVHELCRRYDLAWVPFFPLGSAFAGTPKVAEHPDVVATARRLGVTPGQVGLAWLLDDDPHALLIPGTASPDHLAENLAAGDVVLDDEARALLASAS